MGAQGKGQESRHLKKAGGPSTPSSCPRSSPARACSSSLAHRRHTRYTNGTPGAPQGLHRQCRKHDASGGAEISRVSFVRATGSCLGALTAGQYNNSTLQ